MLKNRDKISTWPRRSWIAFALPHKVAYEPYVKVFQYRILNLILYTNKKLFKIVYIEHDKCSFCDNESETLDHLFYCFILNMFWTNFENYSFTLTKNLEFSAFKILY